MDMYEWASLDNDEKHDRFQKLLYGYRRRLMYSIRSRFDTHNQVLLTPSFAEAELWSEE